MTRGQKWLLLLILPPLLMVLAYQVGEYRIRSSPLNLEPQRTYEVQSGDTVWNIVVQLRKQVPEYQQYDIRDLVDWVLERNNVRPESLEPKRRLVLP